MAEMTREERVFSRRISWQDNVWTSPSKSITVEEVLELVRSGFFMDQIKKLRKILETSEDQYRFEKKRLPAVTFSGLFGNKRSIESIKEYTSILSVDIDKLDADTLSRHVRSLSDDKYTVAVWKTPSGNGLKVLYDLEYSSEYVNADIEDQHSTAFLKLHGYLSEMYSIKIDTNCKDITRLSFLSSDMDLVLNSSYIPFYIECNDDIVHLQESEKARSRIAKKPSQLNRNMLYRTEGKNDRDERALLSSIITFLQKRNISITNCYTNWVKVAFAISNHFTYPVGKGYFLKLCRLDSDKHDEEASINLLRDCYTSTEGKVKLATIIYLAQELGYNRI